MIPCLFAEAGVAPIDWAAACRELSERDRPLGGGIERVGGTGVVPQPPRGTFESLARSIVYQQLSGKAASTIFGRFRALYGEDGFPAPEAVLAPPHPRIRSAGLPGARARAVRPLAARAARGEIPSVAELRWLPPEEVIQRLTVVRGVGRWTVEMLLLFRIGHPDILPVHDLGVRKGLARITRPRAPPEGGKEC